MSRLELIGKKWVVENYENERNLRIEVKNINESIYIMGCKKCVVNVTGKANVITLENCADVGIIFESVISTIQLIRCIKIEIQPTKSMPTVAIDKSDEVNIYMSKETYNTTQVYSTGSSNMRISCIEDDEATEYIIPDQFCTKVIDGKLATTPCTHMSV